MTFNLYGLILGLAILASFQASLWLAKKRRLDPKIVEYLFWWVVAGGIIGARAYHVLDKWNEIYSFNPVSALYVWNGGLAIWGAIIGGFATFYLSLLIYHRSFSLELLDVVLFGLPLGQAIGRWGNYFNNEIVGKNGEPLFFYESILDLVLFGILVLLVKRDSSTPSASSGLSPVGMTRKGTIAGIYLVGYGLIRLFLESFRLPDDQWLIGGVSMATILAIGAVLAGAYFVWKYFKRRLI